MLAPVTPELFTAFIEPVQLFDVSAPMKLILPAALPSINFEEVADPYEQDAPELDVIN